MRDSFVLLKDRRLAMMLLAIAAMSVAADSLTTLTPGFATEIFGQPDTMAGVLVGRSAPARSSPRSSPVGP